MSWLLFSKSSAKVSLPLSPSKTYCLSTFSHGSSRRCRLSSSRSRVNSFSFARNAVRAESHSSCETTGWALILLLASFVMRLPLLYENIFCELNSLGNKHSISFWLAGRIISACFLVNVNLSVPSINHVRSHSIECTLVRLRRKPKLCGLHRQMFWATCTDCNDGTYNDLDYSEGQNCAVCSARCFGRHVSTVPVALSSSRIWKNRGRKSCDI